ncbi:hypothetical protein J2X20_003507 [Pelomonas saccharophila]|uniref:Uncharacterized protein n=1 Tax=Roseateles saccharophilus TaxID=304 RepID=A0ABU1YPS2_ROSSA|nr:hypothetical protein [Roseateles saccharophilus]MDR7270849.1 hypothetical protein [Roseateles saccharophilus]
MSTVLWANQLADGAVTSDEEDKAALFRHSSRLDAICRKLGLGPFSALCDSTDVRFNHGDFELPPGAESTNDVMAKEGVWVDAGEAVRRLQAMLAHITQNKTRFGLLRNDLDDVIAELQQSIGFAELAAAAKAKFNFCIVE